MILTAAFACCTLMGFAQWTTITNGKVWIDTKGDTVEAHAPGFLKMGKTWYMVGEDRSNPNHPDVNLYASEDLQTWRFLAKVIENGKTTPELGTTRFIERAKILHNPKTGKFVIWCHWEGKDYAASEAACFQADNITGPYSLVWSGRPLGIKSRDCNVFTDDDGAAYFISTTTENTDLGLFRLSDDYLSVVSHTRLLPDQRREAPAIVHVDSLYYMLSSACTGWTPNQCKLTVSKSLQQGWSPLENIGDDTAYRTQAAAILKVEGTKDTTYLYVGDRWMDPDLPSTKTIILPIQFKNGHCEFNYYDSFKINFTTGEVAIPAAMILPSRISRSLNEPSSTGK